MAETAVRIVVEEGVELDARFDEGDGGAVAVICHPHPLYGGSMDNNVVLAARDTLAELGIGTLRFDFRGVGRSTGAYDEGVGEAEDVEAAFRWLADSDRGPLFLVGYSFGGWAALRAVDRGLELAAVALVSPPVTFMDFDDLALPDAPCLLVAGDGDDYCAVDDLEQWIESQPGEPDPFAKIVLEGTDHFYVGSEGSLLAALGAYFEELIPNPAS